MWLGHKNSVCLLGAIIGLLFNIPFRHSSNFLWGHPNGESVNHYWMFWRALESGPVCNWPVGIELSLMDPTNLIFYLPAQFFLGPIWSYNLILVGNLLLAYFGGYLLGKHFGGLQSGVLSGVWLMSSPMLLNIMDFGLTESMGVGLFAIYIWMSIQSKPKWWRVLILIAYGYTGVYSCVSAAIFLMSMFAFRPNLRKQIMKDSILALIFVSPYLINMWLDSDIWLERIGPYTHEAYREQWMEQGYRGADLLSIIIPFSSMGPSNSISVGIFALGMVIWRSRFVPPSWVGIFLLVLVFSLGPWIRIAGYETGIPGPVLLLQSIFPPLDGIQHWRRIALLSLIAIIPIFSTGFQEFSKKKQILLWLFLIFDLKFITGSINPISGQLIEMPVMYEEISEGVFLEFPMVVSTDIQNTRSIRRSNRYQPLHENPVRINYESQVYLLKNSHLEYLNSLCFNVLSSLKKTEPDGSLTENWDWFIFSIADCPNVLVVLPELKIHLGEPSHQDSSFMVWRKGRENLND